MLCNFQITNTMAAETVAHAVAVPSLALVMTDYFSNMAAMSGQLIAWSGYVLFTHTTLGMALDGVKNIPTLNKKIFYEDQHAEKSKGQNTIWHYIRSKGGKMVIGASAVIVGAMIKVGGKSLATIAFNIYNKST